MQRANGGNGVTHGSSILPAPAKFFNYETDNLSIHHCLCSYGNSYLPCFLHSLLYAIPGSANRRQTLQRSSFNKIEMKTIIIKAVEFANFQTLALRLHILFEYKVRAGKVEITAPEDELAIIGY